MTNKEIFDNLVFIGHAIAKSEGLKLKEIKRGCKKALGRCHSDGTIEIRMRISPDLEERTKLIESGRTLAHELAHLRYMDHGEAFWRYAEELCKKVSVFLQVDVKPERAHFRSR